MKCVRSTQHLRTAPKTAKAQTEMEHLRLRTVAAMPSLRDCGEPRRPRDLGTQPCILSLYASPLPTRAVTRKVRLALAQAAQQIPIKRDHSRAIAHLQRPAVLDRLTDGWSCHFGGKKNVQSDQGMVNAVDVSSSKKVFNGRTMPEVCVHVHSLMANPSTKQDASTLFGSCGECATDCAIGLGDAEWTL